MRKGGNQVNKSSGFNDVEEMIQFTIEKTVEKLLKEKKSHQVKRHGGSVHDGKGEQI